MEIIGQKKLIEKLNNYTIDTFPRSSLFLGEKGIGKHTMVDYIKENILHLPLIDITSSISYEYILEIYQNPNPSIYLIDLTYATDDTQNAILKFVEEPLNNSFICLIAENKGNILPTITNRCVIFEFEPYTRNELEKFITAEQDKELILSVLRTPGKIVNNYIKDMPAIMELCDKIVHKLSIASFPNTLSIANKINFKDEYNKFDLEIFLDSLCLSLFSDYVKNNTYISLVLYQIVKSETEKLRDNRLNKEVFFEHLLTLLWKAARNNDSAGIKIQNRE